MKKIFILFSVVAILCGCIFEVTTEEETEEQQDNYNTTNVIKGIFNAYNSQNVNAIMSFYDEGFLHNSDNYYDEWNIWYDRLGMNAKVSDIFVTLYGNSATVSFTLTLDTIIYYVPADGFDDVTYLRKRSGVWKVYGNQSSSEEHYSITIESEPPGANIYFNEQNIYHSTPYTINYVSEGTYTIRVYLMGYNEETRTVYVDEDTTVSIDLEWPINSPIINIDSPENGQIINGDEFKLQGYIPFFYGDKATLNLNGDEQVIEVYCGDFNQWISITDQENEFFLRATNEQGNTGVSDIYHIYKSDEIYDIRIELYWDTDDTDVDLHIWDPDSNHCYYGDRYAIPNACLECDDTDGYGPEIFYQSEVSNGVYFIKAHFYEGYSAENPTSAEVEITFNSETTYFGPYEFTDDGDEDGAWWDVTAFTIIDTKLSIEPSLVTKYNTNKDLIEK
ncbi:MAG: PEGA domain-containing protein [Candidatus Cloacimonetes bacterium]|nr:PEGA domain-containing protein [Candidatus Cloacimonadota bacterium]MBL7086148.1 PEGA domain-containing protein [Candidatus Cloacimonadota bacterium]